MNPQSIPHKTDSENVGSDEEMSRDDSQQSFSTGEESEADADDNPEDAGHSYPTPPPDVNADAKANANTIGMKKIDLANDQLNGKGPKSKMASNKPEKPDGAAISAKKQSILSLSTDAIRKLNSRSGSSVVAIVKYIKSTGYEITDHQRFGKLVLRFLKFGVQKGDLVQVKRSFKLSSENKKNSKAVENMKVKKQRLKGKKEAEKKDMEQEKSAKMALKVKIKPSERKTTEHSKRKANVKAATGAQAQADLDAELKPKGVKLKPVPKAKNDEVQTSNTTRTATRATSDNTNSTNAKAKTARKSIGTLAQAKIKAKPSAKAIQKVVAGKQIVDPVVEIPELIPNMSSTPHAPAKTSKSIRKRRNNVHLS